MLHNNSHVTKLSIAVIGSLLGGGLVSLFLGGSVHAASLPFPVIGKSSFSNDFNAGRSNGVHHAIDIIADKHQKIVSRVDGVVRFVGYPQPSWGYAIYIDGDNGYSYRYLHINNDTPGTDDGAAAIKDVYGPDIEEGKRVVRGQLLGYVGDSGNAESTVSHLHFEIYDGDDAINPYDGLVNSSTHLSKPVVTYPQAQNEILPNGIDSTFRGGGSVALGNVDLDVDDEVVTGAGKGGSYVKIFDLDRKQLSRFAPNGTSFTGGVDVALGDVDNDGVDEIITGAGKGGSYVKVFELDGQQISRFAPNGTSFTGGVDVASGDIDNDGVDEIITGAGKGGAYVKAFELDGTEIIKFAPYGEDFKYGITVSAGDVSGDLREEIVTGARTGGGPRVSVYDNLGVRSQTFYAYDSAFTGGIRVEVANVDTGTPKSEILTVPQQKGAPRVKILAATGSSLGFTDYFAEEWWKGYYDLAASNNTTMSSIGIDRRTAVRVVDEEESHGGH